MELADDRDPSSADFGRLRRELLAALGVRRPGAAGSSDTDTTGSTRDPLSDPLRDKATA